ncbi:antirestriction protein, partial [Salmonella enterica]
MHHSNQQHARIINVEESDRLSFLPYLFGDDFMIAEMQVYALAGKMITGY